MSTPLPPDDAETRIVAPPPAVGPPGGPGVPPGGDPVDYEPEPARGLGWGMLLAILVVIAVLAAIAAVYFATRDDNKTTTTTTATTAPLTTTQPAVVGANKVFVPDVTGLKQDAATARLGKAGLVAVITFAPTKKPTGFVVGQKPKAATRVKKGTSVTLTVDKGSPNVAVPDVAKLSVADATAKLQAAGFKTQTTQVTAAGAAPGSVVSQAPAAGDQVAKGAVITLSIAKAAPQTTAATTTTAPATTSSATTTTAPTTTTTAKTTTTTTTTATTTAQPTTATVPDVSGSDVQAAAHAIVDAGLLVTLQYVPSDDPINTVVAQSPDSGGSLASGGHVTVNASSGPGKSPQETVPDARGQSLKQAVATMNGAGVRLIFVKVPVPTRSQVGKIVDQTPAAGQTAPKNAQILVYLGVLKSG